jgi:phosphopantothenoylcysteine synthetase/decarboxylase
MTGVVYLVVTGAPLARRAHDFADEARQRDWQPAVIATSAALAWLDAAALERLDVPLLTDHRAPDEHKRLPPADAVVLAPATFNSINKLAAGIADTYALSVLCEAISLGTPLVAVPFASRRLTGHPAWSASLAMLRSVGATLIDSSDGTPDQFTPVQSGTGDAVTDAFDWGWTLDQLQTDSPRRL